jgi:adenylylsulfate kinase-like enzyme
VAARQSLGGWSRWFNFWERMKRKILIMGLPGAGKTTLANTLAPLLNAIVFNADAVRANLSRDLGFSHEDRVEHARRMGWMCDRVVECGGTVIADFICPTAETRSARESGALTRFCEQLDSMQLRTLDPKPRKRPTTSFPSTHAG